MYKILKDKLDTDAKTDIQKFSTLAGMDECFNTPEWNARGVYDAKSFVEYNYKYDLEQLKLKYNKSENDLETYYWIGINPYKKGEEAKMSTLYYKIKDFVDSRSWAEKHAFNVEAHTKEGYRVHSHLIIQTNQKKYRIIEQLSKYLKIEKNFIDVKKYSIDLDKRIAYIQGCKQQNKESLVDEDIKQREIEGISNYVNNLNI